MLSFDFLPDICTTPLTTGCYLFLLLMLYSFLGWCGEMVYCSLGQRKLCEKRGFLNGPLCPIYGHGALVVLFVLDGGCRNPVLTFLLGMVLTSALEYVTSWAMEKLFHMRWWDYSDRPLNLGGRVCLLNSTLFGLASVALCHWLNPILSGWIVWFFLHKAGIPMAIVIAVIYAADIVLSVRSAIQIGSRLEKLHAIHDELTEKLEQLKEEQRQAMEAQRLRLEEQKERFESNLETARQAVSQRTYETAEKLQSKLEPLSDRGEEFAQQLEKLKAEAQQKAQELYARQDIFERRLMRSYPKLSSPKHGEFLKKLREYWETRKK